MLILKLSCPDQHGIVAKIAHYIASHNGNLLEFNQFTNTFDNKFFARLEIDTNALDVELDSFISGFNVLGEALKALSQRDSLALK